MGFQLFVINWASWLYNTGYDYYVKSARVAVNVYRVATVAPIWKIAENGQFCNSAEFDICNGLWTYEDGVLIGPEWSGERSKKLPVLSCEFTIGDEIVSMDDFLDDFRFVGDTPPLAVIMGTFMIEKKALYPWWNATFNAFLKSGDPVSFGGDSKSFVTTPTLDVSGNLIG